MREKRATIKDVAALSGVSIATVSRVMSSSDYPVSGELRGRVEDAAKKLGFAYTTATRQMRGISSREIALVLPNLSNPFYMQTIQGISAVCYEKKYQLVLCNSQWDVSREEGFLQELHKRRINGVIISSISESPRLAGFISSGMTIVQLDQHFDGDGSFNINYDSRLGAHMAVQHLIEKGHRKIAFASTPLTRWTRREIYKGYAEQLKKAEIALNNDLVLISDGLERGEDRDNYEVRAGEALAAQLVERGNEVTAVFCVNDMVAFGMISGLKKCGKSIPDDISVVGVDDIPLASAFDPPLTTIHCPTYETGRLSALMLIDRLQNEQTAATVLNMHLQPTLVERGSVKNLL